MFNLAHTYRKLGDYSHAIECYNKCIQFNTKSASTYAALGLTFYLSNSVYEAVECYNKALFLRPNDRFTNDLLYIALFECSDNPLV
jgi:anaphase-promoting complex subunit 6